MNRIRILREAAHLTQKQLGAMLSVGNTAVSQYESETRQLDPALICSLCDIFGCSADFLLGRSSTPLPVLNDEDARLLAAYHAAPENVRSAIDTLLAPVAAEQKKAV